ncbi:DUF3000 domain-containing protein [Mumia sp. zg.B53]|uniref:DUF3000 domain-containing protein n=1 Tax=unclassified Mumia TaxID=2621872 RepID=UPI001C6F3A09|nr:MULTISPECIES: DUF3000 domain-containing protein [unclassified Mumia]MBW9206122.1 DUF3000 domain-containing protein [Mumia sp. zg.B17]MBW9211586.1 DUF3000 domain-containing protein [Mumia sp. zg.B21]MBW9216757.1 DUF3000 domain-containing protein [Mumia sp. zg.B53]MDD9350230.1 DUF3000 domain-containing protein [Mumia sp.]
MAARNELDGQPSEFIEAVAALRDAELRPEVVCEELAAPRRIAPYSYAQSGDVTADGDEVGTGRLVLLHDPAGNDAWQGTFRLVTFARAEVDAEMASDPVLPEVGWSWLVEALFSQGASYVAPSGSVTTVRTEGFGGMEEDGSSAQLEIRASWTPLFGTGDTLASHAVAWSELLCTVAGLPPLAPGVLTLPRRGREGRPPR